MGPKPKDAPTGAWLGIQAQNAETPDKKKALRLIDVPPQSPASRVSANRG